MKMGKAMAVTRRLNEPGRSYYCSLPSPETARRIHPLLHLAINTPIMNHLGQKYTLGLAASSIAQISETDYKLLQDAADQEIASAFGGRITRIELDDVLWRRLNRN